MKKLFILICLLLLTGCSVEYDVKITGDKITEKAKLIETNVSLFDSKIGDNYTMREALKKEVKGDTYSDRNYKIKMIESNSEIGLSYKNATTDYSSSFVFNMCYENPVFDRNKKIVRIDTGDDFNCFDFYDNIENIKVVIKTTNKVLSSNADQVIGNSYIWNITEYGNKRVNIEYEEKDYSYIYAIIYILFAIFVLFVTFSIIKIRMKKNNSI